MWEFYNTTADAHPMHIHEVTFEVVNRQGFVLDADGKVQLGDGVTPARVVGDRLQGHGHRLPGPGDAGEGDSSTIPGQFVWHCHIVEHEDNEMMRPYRIGPVQPGQPLG